MTAGTPAAGGQHDGLTVTHRRYVPASHAHYGGNLVDGAYVLALFGDVATEAAIRMDGDEGLFASYSDVQFREPVLAGDVIEVTATVLRTGRRSRLRPSAPIVDVLLPDEHLVLQTFEAQFGPNDSHRTGWSR